MKIEKKITSLITNCTNWTKISYQKPPQKSIIGAIFFIKNIFKETNKIKSTYQAESIIFLNSVAESKISDILYVLYNILWLIQNN